MVHFARDMTYSELLEALPFDLYERYSLLEPIGKLFRPVDPPYRVLDVGGQMPAFWPCFPSLAGTFIPDARAVVVDLNARSELYNYVRASGFELPFRDETFDLVCSFDTLEHISGEHRPRFLSELLRVTRDGLYLAFPFDSPGNRWAESVLVEHTNTVLKCPIPALLERRQVGLPERDSVTQVLAATSYAWTSFA